MKSLLIDTSNKVISLAINDDGINIAEINANVARPHSETLMVYISHLFDYAGMNKSDIDRIIVARGPGSYTGVRIGVTVAKTLAYSLKVELYSVSSLFVLAASSNQEGVVASLFDAQRGNVFAAAYKFHGDKFETIQAPAHMAFDELKEKMKNDDVIFYGNSTEQFKNIEGFSHLTPRISNVERYDEALVQEDVHGIVPEYLRVSEAERNWMDKNQ